MVDFHWPDHNLIVEVDGYRHHGDKRSFDNDRRRDTKLQISGYMVIRLTCRRIAYESSALVADLRKLLGPGRLRRTGGR